MAITGLEAEGTRGRCAFVGAPATTNQSCLAINGTERMCTEYLFWFYRMWGQYLAFKYCQGTKQQSYTASIVRNLPIYDPKDIAEQRAIAEALSDIDGLIAALDRKIAKKCLIKQGAMQQLLTGKKRLPGFTDPWVEKKLGAISHIKTGSCNGDQAVDNGKYPFFVRSQKVYAIDSYSYDGEAILVPGEGGIIYFIILMVNLTIIKECIKLVTLQMMCVVNIYSSICYDILESTHYLYLLRQQWTL